MAIFQVNLGQLIAPLILSLQSSSSSASMEDSPKLFALTQYPNCMCINRLLPVFMAQIPFHQSTEGKSEDID